MYTNMHLLWLYAMFTSCAKETHKTSEQKKRILLKKDIWWKVLCQYASFHVRVLFCCSLYSLFNLYWMRNEVSLLPTNRSYYSPSPRSIDPSVIHFCLSMVFAITVCHLFSIAMHTLQHHYNIHLQCQIVFHTIYKWSTCNRQLSRKLDSFAGLLCSVYECHSFFFCHFENEDNLLDSNRKHYSYYLPDEILSSCTYYYYLFHLNTHRSMKYFIQWIQSTWNKFHLGAKKKTEFIYDCSESRTFRFFSFLAGNAIHTDW